MSARDSFQSGMRLCSVRDFHSALGKERARTDRNGLSFSLILLEVRHGNNHETMRRLIGYLRLRLRTVDVPGWFDAKRPGLLLPSTDFDGCRRLAGAIETMFRLKNIPVAVSCFSYPAQKLEMQRIWEKSSSLA